MSLREQFKQYDRLRISLGRTKIKNPGRVTSLFYDAFIAGAVKISAFEVENRNICGPNRGEYADWRKQMIDSGWLVWNKEWGVQAGPKLIPFLNREKIRSKEIATKEELLQSERAIKSEMATKVELEETKRRLDAMEQSIRRVVEILDPPVDDEKLARFRDGQYDSVLAKATQH